MSDARLPAGLEVGGLLRRAEAEGGNGMVIHKGDERRGALTLLVSRRGVHVACLERTLSIAGEYAWRAVGPAANSAPHEVSEWARKRLRMDGDEWQIELDIPSAERFVDEMTSVG